MADAAPDDGSPPNDLNSGSGPAAIEGDALNVSVTSLGGEVLATVSVSGRASVWELKGLIHSHGLGRSAKFIETTLLLGTQVLADAASLRDVGVVDGTMLSVILAPKYKLLVVGMSGGEMELWSQECKAEHTFVGDYDGVQDVAFSPDNNFLLSVGGICVKLWQVDRRDCIFTFWHDTPVISAAFSPTGTTVLSTQWNCDTKLWGVSSGQCIRSLPPPDTILGHTVAAFTAQGPIVLHMCDVFSLCATWRLALLYGSITTAIFPGTEGRDASQDVAIFLPSPSLTGSPAMPWMFGMCLDTDTIGDSRSPRKRLHQDRFHQTVGVCSLFRRRLLGCGALDSIRHRGPSAMKVSSTGRLSPRTVSKS